MKQLTQLQQKQYQRMIELSDRSRQRYLDAGGDSNRASGSLHNNCYMTAEEKQEFLILGRQLAGINVENGYVYFKGRSWKISDRSANSV